MSFIYFFKNLRLLPILVLPLLAWLIPMSPAEKPGDFSSEKVNLALRRTADRLLRQSGDSTSRIPPIEEDSAGIWRIHLEQPFQYEHLPALLQSSLDMHGIQRSYKVAVRQCADATIDVGYHQLDFLAQNNAPTNGQKDLVPCAGREMMEGCHFIEITFLKPESQGPIGANATKILLIVLGALIGYGFYWWQKPKPVVPVAAAVEPDWLTFGNSRLDVGGQILLCNGVRQTLTFRETKLLRLFASSPDHLLERDFILQHVWADEGILVGRSVDVFVSRLRKKLGTDSSIGIVAVHGIGYRLETGK